LYFVGLGAPVENCSAEQPFVGPFVAAVAVGTAAGSWIESARWKLQSQQ
jgi:hypothetical protein